MRISRCSPLYLVVLLALTASAFTPPGSPAETASVVGDALSKKLQLVREQRARDPEDPALLHKYATLLGKSGDEDGELAYLLYALEAYESTESDNAKKTGQTIAAIEKQIKRIDSGCSRMRGHRDGYLRELSWALRLYSTNQKKYRNALEVSGRILRHRPSHRLARSTVAKILKEADAELQLEAERLLGERELTRPRAYREAWAEEHDSWREAGQTETKGYTVRSNIGYDTLYRAAGALERISSFYRVFYGVDRALASQRTEVFLCGSRAEFESAASAPKFRGLTSNPNIRGFLSKSVSIPTSLSDSKDLSYMFQLFSYDPRSDGLPLADLYGTLFHEASHEYMALAVGANNPASWLNEGMACYFEGVQLGEGGEVLVGLPAKQRLHTLYRILVEGERPLAATLAADVLSGVQYPVAWGLIYYLYHHQEEDGSRPYRYLVKRCVEVAGTGPIDGRALFDFTCASELEVSFEEFETQWIAAMLKLAEAERDPLALAASYRERAKKFYAAGDLEYAREAFHDALLRDPDNAECYLGLALLTANNKESSDKDDTLLWARRAHRAAVQDDLSGIEKEALKLSNDCDPAGFKKVLRAEARYRTKMLKQVRRLIDNERPQAGLAVAKRYLDNVLGEEHYVRLSAELRAEGALDLRRIVSVFDGKSVAGVSASSYSLNEGSLVAQNPPPAISPLVLAEPVAPRMRLEGQIRFGDCHTIVSFLLSASESSPSQGFTVRPLADPSCEPLETYYIPFGALPHGEIGDLAEGLNEEFKRFGFLINNPRKCASPPPIGQWMPFALDTTTGNELVFELNGKEVGRLPISTGQEVLHPSILSYGGEVRLKDLQVIELDRP